jgi:hypothetical protein
VDAHAEVPEVTEEVGGKPTRSAGRASGRAPEAARQPEGLGSIEAVRCPWIRSVAIWTTTLDQLVRLSVSSPDVTGGANGRQRGT